MKQVHNESHTYTAVRVALKEKSRLTLHLRGQTKAALLQRPAVHERTDFFNELWLDSHLSVVSMDTHGVPATAFWYSTQNRESLALSLLNMGYNQHAWLVNHKHCIRNIRLIFCLFLLDSNEIKWMPGFGKIFQYEHILARPNDLSYNMLSTFIDSLICVFFVFLLRKCLRATINLLWTKLNRIMTLLYSLELLYKYIWSCLITVAIS